MDGEHGLDDIAGDSNAGAYSRQECRTGPPLAYVAEKTEHLLQDLHRMVHILESPSSDRGAADRATMVGRSAFRHGLTAFCALYNVLGLMNEERLVARLLAMSAEGFEEWLGQVRRDGSLTG